MRDPRKATHLFSREPRHGQDHANPIQSLLLLGVHADVRTAVKGRARQNRFRGHLCQFAPELLLDMNDVLFQPQCIEHILKPRLVTVGSVAMLDVDAHNRIGDLRGFFGADDHPGVTGEVLVTRDATERETKPNTRLDTEAGLHIYGLKSDVVGILKHRNAAGSIKADIEFARQPIERALIQDMEVPLARIGPRIDEFLWVDAGGRRPGHIPDVVGTRTSRTQAKILDRL